jgi:predicted component of type VI protein secretion system
MRNGRLIIAIKEEKYTEQRNKDKKAKSKVITRDLYKILNTKEGKRKKIKIANARQKKQSLEANSTLGSNFALTDQSVSGGGGGS